MFPHVSICRTCDTFGSRAIVRSPIGDAMSVFKALCFIVSSKILFSLHKHT